MRNSTIVQAGFPTNLSTFLFFFSFHQSSSASGAVSIIVSWLGRGKCQSKVKRLLNIILSHSFTFALFLYIFPPYLPAVILAPQDCSDYNVLEVRKNGVYRVTPAPRNGTFEVFCDMESFGGGWTVIQQRLDGSVSFNRTWAEYKKGFGNIRYYPALVMV